MRPVLIVHAKGGPDPSHILEKSSAVAEVHLLLVMPLPAAAKSVADRLCASVIDASDQQLADDALVGRIVTEAKRVGAQAIATFAEFALLAADEASAQLGLRGVGGNVVNARDKAIMRSIWRDAGVPVPRFQPVRSLPELRSAWRALEPPFLLKGSWSAGSIGQLVIREQSDVEPAWDKARTTVSMAHQRGMSELRSVQSLHDFVAEEMIPATTESWYVVPGYGDYVSVEGAVVEGTYYPVCISGRLPMIPPFTDLGTQSPSVLPEALQCRIIDVSREAVDALGLRTCGTHTEIKLLSDQQLCVVETGARLGGGVLTREVEAVWGVDLIGAVIKALLGEDPGLPSDALTAGADRAAATVALIGANSRGKPWTSSPPFNPGSIPWRDLVSPGSEVEVLPDHLKISPGDPMPRYDGPNGVLNFGGFLFLRAADPEVLLRDSYYLIDHLEEVLVSRTSPPCP